MDKGLDIDGQRTLLAYHAALYGDFRAWFARGATTPPDLPALVAMLRLSRVTPRWDLAEQALTWAAQPDHHILYLGEPGFPLLLRNIAVPPPILFVRGRRDVLVAAQLAIVGSRQATPGGLTFAEELAATLAAHDVVTTSGLAYGIDAAAHRGALRAGETVAVLGCGIDRIYPPRHRTLADTIAERGAVISEFPLGQAPVPANFPRRNRLISGLALGTVVVEAAERSGSISTAMHALEQGREVFAVPGAVSNPLARGCHALLRQGARLTTGIEDIFQELPQLRGDMAEIPTHPEGPALSATEQRLLRACGYEPVTVEVLVLRSGLTVREVSSMLLAFELAGLLRPHTAGTYVRIR